MKRKRPKGGWSKQAARALRTAMEEEYTGEAAKARGAAPLLAPLFMVGAAAVCARNKLAFREATPNAIRALLAADPVKWPKKIRLTHVAIWDANIGVPPAGDQNDTFLRQWKELWLEVTHRFDAEEQKRMMGQFIPPERVQSWRKGGSR